MSKKIEEQVNKSFTNATPDMSKQVIADCQGTTVYRTAPKAKKSGMFWKFATLALALVLVVTGIVGGIELGTTAQAAVIAIDVNPSIEIKVNGRNRVIEAKANNDEAMEILGALDLSGATLDTAVYAIIGSMASRGYLSDLTNSVLVSVDTKKETLYNQIIDLVTSKINVTLKEYNIESSVVAQWIKDKDSIATIARENNISQGKAQLIAKIIDASQKDTSEGATVYTVKDLVGRTVNELSIILSQYSDVDFGNLTTGGNASQKAYITKDLALEIALEAVGITFDPTIDTGVDLRQKIDFEIEHGAMVYEVEFSYGDYRYEVDVEARQGTVLGIEKKLKSFREDSTLPELTDAELVAIATEGVTVEGEPIIEREFGKLEITFQSTTHFYEVEITKRGTIMSYESKSKVQIDVNHLPIEKIRELVIERLSARPGFNVDNISEFECELSDDGRFYEVEIEILGMEFEFLINATTGGFCGEGDGWHGGNGGGNGYHGGK